MYKNYIHLQCEGCGKQEDIPFSATQTIFRSDTISKRVTGWFVYEDSPDKFLCSDECYKWYVQHLKDQDVDETQSTFNRQQEP